MLFLYCGQEYKEFSIPGWVVLLFVAFFPFCLYNSPVKRLAIALYFDQSPALHEDAFKAVVEKSYIPLLKLIKEKKLRVSIFVSLSLLERMESLGYLDWSKTLKEMIDEDRIEILGGCAYSYLLPELPAYAMEQQVILNEYAQAYYFGKKGGFEGDPSLMIRDLKGFYPTKLSLSYDSLNIIQDLGYEWTLASPEFVSKDSSTETYGVKKLKDTKSIAIIVENADLKKEILNKVDTDTTSIVEKMSKYENSVISFEASQFGYVFDQGILLLEKLILEFKKSHTDLVTVSDYLSEADDDAIGSVYDEELDSYKISKYQKLLWDILQETYNLYDKGYENITGYEEVPIWKFTELDKIETPDLVKRLKQAILVNKIGHADNFISPLIDSSILISYITELDTLLADDKLKELLTTFKTNIEEIQTDHS